VAKHLLSLAVANDLAAIPRVAAELEAFGLGHGIGHRDLNRFNLALEEVLTNAISYGFPAGGRHDIEIQVAWRPDGPDGAALEATVSDDGVPFDPLAAVPPDLGVPVEHRKVGGLGIHLLRALTEEIDYRRDGGRNVLRFRLRAGGRRGQD
jgi:anti-sigma regulatory factor (Ser/Thr protein kinase)